MALAFEAPVLQVDANVIHKVDTSNPQNLHRMWTLFQKCADSVAHGRRLENLSWRLWQREMFCVEQLENVTAFSSSTSAPLPIRQPARLSTEDVPQLSGSVDSVVDDEALDLNSDSAPLEILRPRIRRQDSLASSRSRGKERHITSCLYEKMVVSIVHQDEPLTAPLPKIASLTQMEAETESKPEPSPFLTRSGSTSTEHSPSQSTDSSTSSHPQSSLDSAQSRGLTTVVRGFSPKSVSIHQPTPVMTKSDSNDSIPQPEAAPAAKHVQPKKQPAKFALGGSSSCEESSPSDPRSFTAAMSPVQRRKMMKAAMPAEHSGSLKRTASRNATILHAMQRQPASSARLVVPANSDGAIDEEQSETEADYVDESAIDDEDDSSDWEDSNEDSGRSSMDDRALFQRVDSKANLTSRPSLITLMLAKNETAQRYTNHLASQSTSALSRMPRSTLHQQPLVASPNESDEAPLTMKSKRRAPPMRPINEIPRSVAQPIVATANHQAQAALSPRTTRRNMLSSELTESLRRNLLWERQQKTSTANAVLKRRHTSQDVANLRQYPERVHMNKDNDVNASSWDAYLDRDSFKVW